MTDEPTTAGRAARAPRELVRRHAAAAGFAAFALVAAAARIADYQAPLSGDATQFLYVGETVANGGMPYADAAYSSSPMSV